MAIALVEFQNGSTRFLAAALAQEGLATRVVTEAGAVARSEAALVLVGPDLPQALAFIADLRARHPATPQMVVTDRDEVDARIAALEAGADDCLSKPFHFRELVAKLNALRRRSRLGSVVPLLDGGEAAVDQVTLKLKVADKARSLTKREADLLVLLAQAGGTSMRRDEVLRDGWAAAPGLSENLVDVYVGYLRRKLTQLGADVAIKCVRGEGFRLVAHRVVTTPRQFRRTNRDQTL